MLFLQVILCSIGLDYSTLTLASSNDTTNLTKVKKDCVMFTNGTYSLSSKNKYSIKANNTSEFTLEELKRRNEIIEEIQGDFFKLKGYEVLLNKNTLNSLYFKLLNLDQPNLYVSLYDYLNPNELYNDVRLVHPHFLKSVVNESLAHASYVALKNKEEKIICVNLRGSKAVISEYEFDWLNKENLTEENKLINENKTENALNERTEDKSNDKEIKSNDKPKDKKTKVKLVNRIICDDLLCDKKIYDYFGEYILEEVNKYTKENNKLEIANLNIEDLKKDFFDSLKKNKTEFKPLDLRINGINLEEFKEFDVNLVEFYEKMRIKLMDEFVKFKSKFSEKWYNESVKVSVMSSFSEFVFFKFDSSNLWLESEEPFQEFSICKGLVILNKIQHEPNSFVKTVNHFEKFDNDCWANIKLAGVENEKFSSDNKYLLSFQEFLKSGNKKKAAEYLQVLRTEEEILKNKEPGRRIQAFNELKTQLAMFNTLPKEVQEMAIDKFNEVKEWYDNNNKKDVKSEVIYDQYDKFVGRIDFCTKRYLEEKKKKESVKETKPEEAKQEEEKIEETKQEENKPEDTKLEEEKKKFDKLLNNDLFNKTFFNNGMFDKEMFNEFMKNEKLFNEEMEEKENPKEEL